MYERYNCPLIKTVEFYVLAGTKHTELSNTFTVTEFAKTHLQQSETSKNFFACGALSSPLLFVPDLRPWQYVNLSQLTDTEKTVFRKN